MSGCLNDFFLRKLSFDHQLTFIMLIARCQFNKINTFAELAYAYQGARKMINGFVHHHATAYISNRKMIIACHIHVRHVEIETIIGRIGIHFQFT